MEQQGFSRKDFDDVADVYVINTCSVTDNADKECREIVRRIKRKAPNSSVVVTGCYAQLKPDEIAGMTGVDLVLGAAEKFELPFRINDLLAGNPQKVYACDIEDITGFNASTSEGGRTRVFLKVQDGCDYNCSFCTIPLARGHSRSDTIANVVANVNELAATGTKEVVLTGINLGDFGKGSDGGKRREESFMELLLALEQTPIQRFRISSIEPNLLTPDIVRLVAESKRIMPHFHIPLQSGSDTLLGAMRRRYRTDLYAERIDLIKQLLPHCSIGVDVIVGFPGETEKLFSDTFDYINALPVSYLHVFTYSERDNTHALSLGPVIPVNVRRERNSILRDLSYKKARHFRSLYEGAQRPVLFERGHKGGIMSGYSDNYIKVQTMHDPKLENEIVPFTIF